MFHVNHSPVSSSSLGLILDEMPRQNLIAASTAEHIWARHIVDSAQLVPMAPTGARGWIDIGSGAGFPGIVVALMCPELRMTLVESRRKRIDFLQHLAEALGPRRSRDGRGRQRLEMLDGDRHDVISARAFAPLDRLLPLAHRFSGDHLASAQGTKCSIRTGSGHAIVAG